MIADRSDPYVSGAELRRPVYAITVDMGTTALQASSNDPSSQNAYDDACNDAYNNDMGKVLQSHGFGRQHGGVYFGDETVDAVRCVLAVQALSRAYAWFSPSVRDIRMLRIEDNNDLMPAVAAVTP